jgi:hypothetical protein
VGDNDHEGLVQIMGLFSRKKYDGKHGFPLYTKGGVCDVCSRSLSGVTAYVVPAKEFYGSARYKVYSLENTIDFLKNTAAGSEIPEDQLALFAAAELAKRAQTDKTPSAVCENCIDMFE